MLVILLFWLAFVFSHSPVFLLGFNPTKSSNLTEFSRFRFSSVTKDTVEDGMFLKWTMRRIPLSFHSSCWRTKRSSRNQRFKPPEKKPQTRLRSASNPQTKSRFTSCSEIESRSSDQIHVNLLKRFNVSQKLLLPNPLCSLPHVSSRWRYFTNICVEVWKFLFNSQHAVWNTASHL